MKINLPLAIVLLFFVPFNTMGGWIITSRYVDSGGKVIPKRYFFENSKARVETYDLIYSCDLKTGSIILVDPVNLVYTQTNLEAYTDKMREIKLKRLNRLLALMPEDQRAVNEKKYKEQVEAELVIPPYNEDSVAVTQFADSVEIKILNLFARHYKIEVSGQFMEEFLFSDKVKLSADFDQSIFLQYIYLLEPDDITVKYRASEKYLAMVKDGLVVGRNFLENGFRTDWLVSKIEKKTIPDYEFGIPTLCKEVTLDKWLMRSMQADDKYYDDYE